MRYALYLILLLLAGYHSIVHAVDATVSASWSNATVSAAQILELVLTTGDDPLLPADALLEIQLNSLFTVASDAGVDEAVLRETLSGTWSVTVDTSAKKLTVQRSGDGAEMASTTHIRFKLTGVTNPSRAGRISVGTIEISDTGAQFTRTLQLPTMEIEPGVIWNAQLAFSNLLSGRSASVMIHMTLPHVVPNDGVIAVYFPYMYGSMSGVTLSSVAGLNGDFIISTTNNAIWIKRDVGSGTDSAEVQDVVIELEGITHPLVEGPLGPSVLLQTLDAASRIIDQTYVDTSDNVLAKARVVLSSLSLRVTEGDVTGAQYTVSLSAPPYANTALTLSVGDSATRAKLTLDPDSLVFSASNWSTPAKITVTASNDFVVSGTSTQESTVRIGHTIISGDSGNTFAAINEVNVHISENDFPAVHISDRFLAVVERLRNDSYQISLLSQPSSEVIVQMTPQDSFIETFPDQVVFTASSWNTPKVINVVASVAASTLGSYSLEDDHVCHVCPAGSYCPDQYSAALNCATGTYSLGNATVCTPCGAGVKCSIDAAPVACAAGYYSINASTPCLLCDAGSYCPSTTLPPTKCVQGTYSHSGAVACTACPYGYTCTTSGDPVACALGETNNADHSACISCPKGYECSPLKSVAMTCATGTYSLDGDGYYSPTGSGSCVECPRGYYCDTPNEMPKNCSVGYYSLRASTSCLACDPGYECPRSDQLPQPCPVGYYSEGAVANCRSCYPGYKCSLASTNPTPEEDACPMGGYCNPPTTFFLCPAGTFGNVTAGESIDHACAPCPEGYYCEMGTTPLTRQTCPAGFFCPEGTKRASQNPCPAGTYNPNQGQKSSDVCQVCPAGSYCPTGSSQPQPCPQGYYCLEGTRTVNQYPCPAGTFSGPQTGLTIGSQCNECPLGSYCPEASSTPTKCPAGRYNPKTGAADLHECLDCPPGWSCPHVGQSDYVDRCAKGHYCPGGTVLATDHPCPAGTYTESVELIRSQDCIICPLRHSCLQGTGGETQTMLDCGPGFFCPNGTAYPNQFPCLPGTWSSSTSLSVAAECDICPPGKYCQGGKSFIDGSCAPGHYCPLGTYSSTQFPCPSGTYTANTWLFEPSQCDDCPPGYYCPAGSVAPIPCKAGSYTSVNNTKTVGPADAWPACITCPAGYYCIEASVTPKACGKGKFSSSGSKACSTCEAGYFCNSETTSAANMRSNALGWSAPGALYGTCYNGTYCPAGSDSEPALETDACPPGYYCPTATPSPIICPAGTYSNLTGQDSMSDCTPTPAGYFSLAGALESTGVCSPGFYCPLRSTSRTQVPCPARYYLNRTMGQSEDDCALCVSGSYCPIGTAYPVTCPAGYYCRTGIASPEPCPIGTYANATGLRTVDDCLQCPPGMYCDSTALTVPRGLCDPGYYCTLGAYTSAPMNYESTLFGVTNRHTGNQCPPGAYCPLGSSSATLCPPGAYNNFTGLESVGQCVPCPPGEYCETPGLLLPTASCHPGYYCIGGAAIPTQMETPAGFFSLVGATAPSPCPPGQFNLYPAQDKCVICPAGFYCGLPGTITPTICPTGNYCPEGTGLPVKCQPGTFADVQGLVKIEQCEPCPSGQYCDSYGLSAPSGPCLAGFVCSGGSPVANPMGQSYGYVCPAASYCPDGTGSAIPCPVGSFRAGAGGTSLVSCSLCPGGKHCSSTGLTAPSGSCSPGYYCVSDASTPTPVDNVTGAICPPGFYCPEASPAPIKCSAGTYAADKGQDTCDKCPMGYFCDGVATSTYADCPAGHYCPTGTAEIPVSCPVGTFSNSIRLTNVTECQNCTAGSFCATMGLVQPTGLCAAGNFCPPRSESAFGRTADNDTHMCSAGAYCPEGTYLPIPCPTGTYSNDTGLVKAGNCIFCDEGSYCTDAGLVKPTGLCDAGYYCKRNNTQPNPSSGVVKVTTQGSELVAYFGGQVCPIGSYCPQGAVSPILCPEGFYSNVTGSSTCLPCPPGFFCPLGCSDYRSNECPIGHYCPECTQRATQFPCPPGSFGDRTGLQDLMQCTPAPGGTFIDGYAAVEPTGNCRSGFYCSGGSATGTPAETTATGGPCLPGTNCPEGSAVPIVCDAGAYCSSTNTDAALPCKEGFYCVQGSYTATPTGQNNSLGTIGDVCTRGHYCPQGTSNPIPCLPGTYSETTQNVNASYCLPCSPGFICSTSGIVTPFEKCPAGFICAGGDSTATQLCPKGSECPEGSFEPRSCPAGTFVDEKGLSSCKLCPERYYCEAGSITPLICPQGYYCPLQTPSPRKYPCLAGSFGDQTALASSKECAQCPPGKFCSGLPPTNSTSGACAPGHYCIGKATTAEPKDRITGGLCDGGHVCFGGAWVPDPIDGITGRICDPGFYCPEGSFNQIRCPKGTYNSVEKQKGIENPVFCPNGTYGHEVGLMDATECAPCPAGKFCVAGTVTASCTAGYYCKLRNDHPNPVAAITNGTADGDMTWRTELGGPCPIGYYCPEGVLDPFPCPKNSSRLQTLGIAESDCDPCPAGKSCNDGTNTVPCPAGSYCPYGVSDVPCPAGTFNGAEGKANQEDCVPCDAGKLCNRTGILDLTDYDCPPGNYCLRGSFEPQPCPAGQYRAVSGAKSSDDCLQCIGGSYCEAGVTQPTVCNATTYCPVGVGSPRLCPGGSYCPYNTTTPVTCPEGFFCSPAVDSPSICTLGHYCPSGTTAQIPCPLGYLGRTTPLDGAYTSLYSSCEACPPGTFGIDVNRTRCDECLEGFVCLGATNSSHPTSREVDRGYPCPTGYYCPAGSSSEIACPRGTYQPSYKASNESACLLCPENSYQNSEGQASCLPCSTSAFAGTGATKCTCVGSHRAFQMTDGYCICEPGYEFYDQDMILRSDEDGDVDCQPIVYDRCSSNQVRSDSGSCVSASGKACDATCNNGTGTYVASLGVCQCDEQPDLDTVCNKKCRDEATQIQVNSSTGELQLYNPVTGEVLPISDEDNTSGLVSKVSCTSGSDCQLHSITVASTGFSGSYDLPPLISDATSRRRRLTTASTSSSIANPMVCLSVGGGLLFDLSVPRSYPIYMKDSMLNTNPSFDYGAFRSLATKVNANTSTVSAFAFSFTEPGTYVFGNSLNSAAQTIVVVMKTGTSCPTEAPIVPLNEKNLVTVSAKRRTDDIILAPDWGLIMGLLGGLFGVVIAVIGGLYYFRAKSWTNTAVKSISGYRAKNKQVNLAAMHSKGTVAVTTDAAQDGGGSSALLTVEPTTGKQLQLGRQEPMKGTSMEYHADLGRWDEEDLDLRELVDRLQFHHEAVTKNFEDQKGDVKQLMQHLHAEAIELKRLFVNALVASDLMSTSPDASKEDPGGSETTEASETLPVSKISGRLRSKSVAGREKFLLENLERDLQDREQFEQKKTAMLGSVSADLREVEGWSAQLAELTGAIVQEMSSPVDDRTPESTSTNEESCLEHTRMVLDDLKTLLGSDPMTQTSSSLVHLAEQEKGRREVGNFVLEASQRYFTPRSAAQDSTSSNNVVHRLLELHDDVEKTQNKEDEALFGPLSSLQKFGAALPQVLATIDDLETSFRRELDAVREEQNPVKERAVQAQMQSRLSKLLKEVAAGAKKVNERLEKEAPRTIKLRHGAQHAEDALSRAVTSAKEQWDIANQEQRDRIGVATSAQDPEEAVVQTPSSVEELAASKLRDDTLFQIKDLLVGLTTLLRTNGVPLMAAPQQLAITAQPQSPPAWVDSRVVADAKRNNESATQQSAAEYASELTVSYPQLSAVDKERLLDDFASDLRTIQSSVSVEATRTQAELATRQAATEALVEAKRAYVQRREQEDADVLRAQHDEEEQSLESQFRDEELAIEQEYLKELSSLEMEFGSDGGDEAVRDFAGSPDTMFDDFANGMEGDESSFPGLTEAEDIADILDSKLGIPVDDNADIIAQLNDVYSQAWNDRVRILAMEEALKKEQLNERLRRKRNALKGSTDAVEEGNLDTSQPEKELNELMLESSELKEEILEEIVKKQDDMDVLQQEAVNRAVERLRQQVADCEIRSDVNEENDLQRSQDALTELVIAARHAAQADKVAADKVIAHTEDELQMLQNEYDRDFMALREEIENERLRLNAKMQSALSAKRRRGTTKDEKGDDEVFAEQTDGDLVEELETQLEEFTNTAIEELRDKHFQLQQKVEAEKTQATVAVAVAEAQLAYLDELPSSGQVNQATTKTISLVETPRSRVEVTEELLEALANRIPVQIELQFQEELDKLHVDYMLACAERRRELEADAAMRRAKLAEKMNRRRLEKESNSSQEERKHQPASSLAEALDAQEQVELAKIDEELKAAIAALDDYERQGGETLAKSLASTLHSCGKEVEGQIRQCRQQHEVAASLLKPADDKGAKELANTVVNVLDALESEASQRAKAAAQAREAIEHEIERLQDESSSSLAALTVALDAEKRRQEQRLKQRMKQRREQQQTQLPVGSSPEKIAEMNAVLAEQEMVERQKLEDQLETQAQLAFDEERGKQREHEDRLAQQLREATVAEIAASTTKEAVAQARNEYLNSGNDNALTALMRLWRTRQPSKSSVKEATKLVRKRSVASRLAALAAPSLTVESSSVKQNVVADTMAAEMEQQIKALSASHLRAWQQRQQELQEEEARRKAELESRLRRKRDAKLHAGSQQTDKGDEEDEQLHQQLVTDAIKRKFAMEAEIDMDLELIATAVQSAGGQTTSDIEALLAACHSTIEAETAALGDTLRVQRQAQEEALRQRLQQRRRDKVRELESTGKSSDPSALAALEDALKEVEATELRSIAGKETQQLSALHERLRSQVGAAFAEADRKAKRRCDDVNARLASSEEELNGIYREHEEGRRALRESLGVEQRRQQDKLLERMARRRAERLADLKREHPNDLSEAITQKAMLELNNEHEGERLRLEDGISEQTTKALQELDDKTREKETFLQAETRRLRAEAEAAQAAREALAVAHCAEAERVTREFYACLGGGVDVEKLKAQDRRRRIEERLATKHSRKTKVSTSSGDSQGREQEQFSSVLPAETQSIVVDDLESELQRLHDEHDREWGALKARLDDETRLRKAQLAERLQRKRQSLQNNTALSSEERQVAEAALDRAAERESLEIDASAALAARALRLAVLQAKEQAADTLTASFASSSDELDTALEATRKQHDEAQRKLRETLEMERRKQEQLFQERRRQRRAARRAGTEPMPKQGTEEAEEEGLKRELETQLCAEQAQAWTALREREQQDVEAVLAPLEAAVGRRLDDAELAERRAREELERLAEEHDRRLAELRESLEAEKKRQQLALREKLRRKRDQRRADGVSMPDEEARGEERQAMEALETSFETNLASAESEALENRREKGTELLAQVCALSASRAAEEAALTLLDAARLEAERVREEYEAALASRVQVSAVADAISREEMAKRLADRRQKRRQDREQQKPREITVLELTPNEPEDGGSVDREIAVVQAAHARGVKSRRDQLDAETAARKAALAARLEHKRRAARQSGESGKSEAEIEKALLLEEQEELAAIEQERVVEEREIEAEASREKERLAKTLREADERGAADIEQQLSACKQAHDTESAKLEEALRAERARQELALKQRLNAKRQRIQAGGGGATDKDSNDTEATNEHEVQAAQAELEEQERVARQQLTERQQQELADVARKLEQETEAQRLAAFDLQAAAERELKRLEEEHARERRALQEALLADQRKRETQLREKLAKKKAARQAKGSSDRQDEEDAEEGVAMAALQEEIMQEQAEALGKERERQETAMRLAAAELQEAATASAKAAAASRQAQEEAARVAAEFDRHRGEAQQLQTAEAAHSKSKLADRLAEKKNKRHLKQQQKQENDDGNAAAKSLEDEAERLRLEAQIEAQLVACREAHDAEAAKLRESLQAERERQERALQERIARRKEKRNLADAQASTKADVKAAEEAELKQQQEEEAALAAALAAQEQEAWDTIERKQGEDIRVLQEQKQQQERERAVRQQQQAQQEMNRLQEEHERELRALTASLAQEQARQEEKLQQRIAQRRARKQRQEEETAGTSAKAQQSNVDAEEEARITAESQRAKALAQAQAQAEAEAEEKERQEIAARLALKLEEERARQRREKEELEARLNREAEEQAAKRAEALALQLQQQAIETADKMAHEFNTNLRELRETHSADGAAQKARLESRIAAKKTRKLRELEEKRELERQRLHARQQQEAEEAAKAEKEREEALAEAARQAAIPVAETIVNDEPAAVAVLCPAEEKAEANRQQQQDVAAVQQLFTYGLVPGKLSLLGAVELVVGARHERELAVQLVELATKTLDNVRQALQAVTQQKAARKAQALQEISSRQASSAETDTVLSQIDAEFAEKLREAECLATEESEKTKREAEKRLKERQMREVAFLLAHFDAQHTEALTNVPAIATQVQPLQQQPQQPTMTAAQREAEDLVAELRARLELEADERRRELEEEKRLELERLAKEEQDQLAQVEAGVAALLAEERAAMARLQVSRLQKLPPGAVKQREAAERERTAQLQRLTLMLEGRGRQQKDRVRARIVQQKALIEDEFRRKGQIIIAVMNQRLVQEKAGLRQRQELLKPYPENAQASDQAPQQQDKDTSQSMLTDELAKRLEDVLEERLAKIEALVADFKHNVHDPPPQENTATKETNLEEDSSSSVAYRLAVAEAVAAGCRYEKLHIADKESLLASSAFGVLDANAVNASKLAQVSANKLDDRMRVRRDFAELLLQAVAAKDEPAAVLAVVELFGRENNGRADYASFSPQKKSKGTLYLSLAALQDLSTGQLAVVMLHALAQARANTSDLTEPQFVSHLYNLLVRCYQGLFLHVQQQQRATSVATASTVTEISRKSVSDGGEAGKTVDTSTKVQWQARLLEMEGFLTRMGSQKAAIQRSQSSQLRLLPKQREGDNAGEASASMSSGLWQQEQGQVLQEKLDTAEKLYLQVLRQHEQQTQTVEYWQDLLAEQREAEYEEDAFDEEGEEDSKKTHTEDPNAAERQQQREARAQEAQSELDGASQVLEATRKERDELFAQCQQLRDQLNMRNRAITSKTSEIRQPADQAASDGGAMAKERISSEELAQRKEEYYELLATSDSTLQDVLNQRGGLVLARVGRYQPWPARFSEPGEFAKMARYRAKKGQACVYFFGSRNYGWVSKSSIQPFPEDLTTLTASNKYNQQHIQDALDEAKLVMDGTDETGKRFFDRIMERKEEAVDLPCERCNRVDDHYSLLILCDGKNCKREYHMNCLTPPLVSVPPGEWFCPDCEKEREKEREKELQKRAKAEAIDSQDSSVTAVNGLDGTLPLAKTPSTKKTKKHKHNSRDGIVKRRLSSVSPDRPGGPVKKPRGHRSSSREVSPPPRKDPAMPKKLDGRKKKPSQLSISSSRAQLLSDPDNGTADDELRSEEKCLICGFGGELIVCEFTGCTKVYHQFCLGAYPFPKDEDATWYCPRHTCALTGEKESCEDGEKSTNKLKHASPRKPNVKNLLWKCNQCPLAISDGALPQLPQGQVLSKKSRTFLCSHCYLNASSKVQLSKRLEKIWSTLATNRQGMPFCGPLLCGVEPVDGQLDESRTQLDLFKVLARIRRLEYEDSAAFSRDIDEVVANAVDLIANRSYPLMEAAKTLKIIRNEQFAIHQQKLDFLDSKIRRVHADRESGRDNEDDLAAKRWPFRWRQECGPFEDKYYPRLEAKSLDEWTALVSAAPLYASADEFDGRSVVGAYMSDEMSASEDPPQGHSGSARSRSPSLGSANELSDPPAATRMESSLTLSEGTDVMLALGDLSKPGAGIQKRRFGGEQTKELDSMDAREFFLSPSTSEMQHVFDQQSTLLRSALEAHSTLQRSWLISQQDMLGLGGNGGFSVGEGRLAAELRLANKNLRQRLRNKDKLVDQLTSDHMALRAEVINLQRELSQSKSHARELEDRIAVVQGAIEGRIVPRPENHDPVSNGDAAATPDRSTDEEHLF
ncbi:hypothetical protein PC113_g2544 [Phytophthora cactorum]|uniref:Uncharacterized protein n=1 Tax=Phytophthora cactorum TaxID=29920 RepID=A0A8T0ZXB2_9STRA|nr:hypothetical protein PC113_g2544 [Phytophthora cactorum]